MASRTCLWQPRNGQGRTCYSDCLALLLIALEMKIGRPTHLRRPVTDKLLRPIIDEATTSGGGVNEKPVILSAPSPVSARRDRTRNTPRIGQHLPVCPKRLPHQTTPGVVQEIEQHIAHRTPLPSLANPPRIGQPMPPEKRPQIGPTLRIERH
jgi:hypothetical protein